LRCGTCAGRRDYREADGVQSEQTDPMEWKTLAVNILLSLFVMVLWGFSYVVTRVTVKDGIIPPFTLAFARFTIGLLVLMAIPVNKAEARPAGRDAARMVLMGFFGIFLYFSFENFGLVYTSATNASILVSLAPVMTVVGAAVMFRQEVRLKNWAGMLLAFGGSALVVWNGKVNFELNPLGDLLIVLSAAAWAAYTLIGNSVVRSYRSIIISRRILFTGVVMFAPFSAWEILSGQAAGVSPLSLLGVAYLGLFSTAAAFFIWNKLLADMGMVMATNMIYLQCAVTMLCAWATIGEPISGMLLAGTAAVLAGLYLAIPGSQRKKRIRVNGRGHKMFRH